MGGGGRGGRGVHVNTRLNTVPDHSEYVGQSQTASSSTSQKNAMHHKPLCKPEHVLPRTLMPPQGPPLSSLTHRRSPGPRAQSYSAVALARPPAHPPLQGWLHHHPLAIHQQKRVYW
jgi:hypothetical protein